MQGIFVQGAEKKKAEKWKCEIKHVRFNLFYFIYSIIFLITIAIIAIIHLFDLKINFMNELHILAA